MLKIGIVGGGVNSAVGKAHFSAIQLLNNYSIVAGCFSRNSEVNIKTGEFLNLSNDQVCRSFDQLLDEKKHLLDAVLILTPTDQHHEQVTKALEANLNVICEKALTQSVEKATSIENTLKHSKGKLFVIYNYLGYPMIKELRSMINDGALGEILHIQTEMPQESFIKVKDEKPLAPQSWRLSDDQIPTISLDLGVHLHMMVNYLINKKPLRTVASSSNYGHFKNIVDDVKAIIKYEDNIECAMWYSKVAIGYRNGLRIRVTGTKGAAEWYQLEPEIIQFCENSGALSILDRNSPNISIADSEIYNRFKGGHPIGFIEALANYYSDISDELLSKRITKKSKEVFGINEALEGLLLFDAIARSSQEERWVNL